MATETIETESINPYNKTVETAQDLWESCGVATVGDGDALARAEYKFLTNVLTAIYQEANQPGILIQLEE